MGKPTRRIALALLLLIPAWTSLATQHHPATDSDDDSTADDAFPSPSPSHTHKHTHHTPSPTPDDSDSPTPKPAHKKAHPSPSDADADSDSSPAHPPATKTKHHLHKSDDDSTSGNSDTAVTRTPTPDENIPSDTTPTPKPNPTVAPDATIDSSDLQDFPHLPERIRALIESSLDLTRQSLTYTYSSADPANGGMDCSGFVYYILTQAGLKDVPRDASDQYIWLRKANKFRAVISRRLDGFEMDDLKPGDLLFWIGTYDTQHDPPVTHTMIYLGREKSTGARVMVGSSDGRSYHGLQRWGVSVFDFKEPAHSSATHPTSQFIGYGSIPGL